MIGAAAAAAVAEAGCCCCERGIFLSQVPRAVTYETYKTVTFQLFLKLR